MCLKFPDFEAGRAYELGAYKKKHVREKTIFHSGLWGNRTHDLHTRLSMRDFSCPNL